MKRREFIAGLSAVRRHGRWRRARSQKPLRWRASRSTMTLRANSMPFCNRRSSSALPKPRSSAPLRSHASRFSPKKTCSRSSTFRSRRRTSDSTFWISNQVRSPPTSRRTEEPMDPTRKPPNSKAFSGTWTWSRSARSRPPHPEVTAHYRTIVDRYDGTVYRNMVVAGLEGVAPYNRYINHTPPFKWVIHPNWYTTAGFRAKNNGMLGRSNGCITVDPVENNKIITRLQGALIYVTVGDAPIEQYL